jgi:membrane protease YdiL (CAAX protease family)
MAIYVLVGAIIFVPFIPILKIVGPLLPRETTGEQTTSYVNIFFVLTLNISFLLAAWATLKWIDRRPPALLGVNFSWASVKEFALGVGIGLGNFGAVYLCLLLFGWVTVAPNAVAIDSAALTQHLAALFVFAAIEELINRGYLFQAFCEGAGILTAAVVTSAIFSLVHIVNPAFSVVGAVFLFVHGLLYAAAYLKTRSLWTPIGLHMAWNAAQGPIAGMKVSGSAIPNGLFTSDPRGPELLSGGAFGIEGSIVSVVISAVVLVAVWKSGWLRPSVRFREVEGQWLASSQKQADNHDSAAAELATG